MKRIEKAELYENLNGFLKTKGIELKEGSYAQAIQKSCSFLADAINLGQQGLERARGEMEKRVDDLRQVIHEKTAPPASPTQASAPPPVPPAAPPPTRPRARNRPTRPIVRRKTLKKRK